MRFFGSDVIQIGPGHAGRTFWQMRATELAPEHVRVLVTFFTPVDHALQLRVYRGPQTELR